MINWDKPIETIDGRKAKLLSCVMPVGGDYSSGRAVYVSPPPGAVFGDVFLVNEEGFRCDDSAPISRPQIIRNARVKREGWVVKYKDQDRLWDGHIYSSEKSAVDNSPVQTRVVRMEWEE